jgi:hypothetical protein
VTDQFTVTLKFGLLPAFFHLAVFEDVKLALMVWVPVFEGVKLTVQLEVVAVAAASVHGSGTMVPDDCVRFDVPRGAPLGANAEVFVTVAMHDVLLPSVIEVGLHVTETLVLAAGRGVGVLVGVGVMVAVAVGGGGVAVATVFGTNPWGINPLLQASPVSPPVLFWSPSCTMNSNRYTWPTCNASPFLSRRLARLQRTSAP